MNLKTVLGAIAVAILLFFGITFAMASTVQDSATRLATAALMFVAAFGIAYYITREPKTIIQKLEVSGEMKTVPLKCPNCSASADARDIRMVSGVPYTTCPYCGHTFEVTEEPKW